MVIKTKNLTKESIGAQTSKTGKVITSSIVNTTNEEIPQQQLKSLKQKRVYLNKELKALDKQEKLIKKGIEKSKK